MGLQAVPDPPVTPPPGMGISSFQGKAVKSVKVTVAGANKLEINDRELKVDDICRLAVECRVTGVHFDVDEASGDLVRVQRLKVIDAEFAPWDPDDPNDDGVQR